MGVSSTTAPSFTSSNKWTLAHEEDHGVLPGLQHPSFSGGAVRDMKDLWKGQVSGMGSSAAAVAKRAWAASPSHGPTLAIAPFPIQST